MTEIYGIPPQTAISLYKKLHHPIALSRLELYKNNYSIITLVDEAYPPMLKTIQDAPLVLYAKGNLELLQEVKVISVIGTRNPTTEAYEKTQFIVKPLVMENWTIVSGMALGIDSFAHQHTLIENGKTIAVLGSGFKHIYPRRNISLFKKIVKSGLVITEYPPDVAPKPYHFPERNRIISGLSLGTVVIEATEKSGTLITVDQALDQGREVYALPGSPLVAQTKGCHKIIQEGAKLVMDIDDILEDWQLV